VANPPARRLNALKATPPNAAPTNAAPPNATPTTTWARRATPVKTADPKAIITAMMTVAIVEVE
jgi:hypothetical protein